MINEVNCRGKDFPWRAVKYVGNNLKEINAFCDNYDFGFMKKFYLDPLNFHESAMLTGSDVHGHVYNLYLGDWLIYKGKNTYTVYTDEDFTCLMEAENPFGKELERMKQKKQQKQQKQQYNNDMFDISEHCLREIIGSRLDFIFDSVNDGTLEDADKVDDVRRAFDSIKDDLKKSIFLDWTLGLTVAQCDLFQFLENERYTGKSLDYKNRGLIIDCNRGKIGKLDKVRQTKYNHMLSTMRMVPFWMYSMVPVGTILYRHNGDFYNVERDDNGKLNIENFHDRNAGVYEFGVLPVDAEEY